MCKGRKLLQSKKEGGRGLWWKLTLIEYYVYIWARCFLSVKLQTISWNPFYSFHFIEAETEASERLGNKQLVGRRDGIPIHECLIPKCCWTVKCQYFQQENALILLTCHSYIDQNTFTISYKIWWNYSLSPFNFYFLSRKHVMLPSEWPSPV